MSNRLAGKLLNRCGLALLFLLALGGATLLLGPLAGPRSVIVRAAEPAAPTERLDPAAWGADHVGQAVPEFVEGGECLFCHRGSIGRDWQQNRHSKTIHDITPDGAEIKALSTGPHGALAAEVEMLLGHTQSVRYLKRGKKYGHLDLLSVGATGSRGGRFKLSSTDGPTWLEDHFNQRCAGCHATAVDPELAAFASPSLDCFVCHGDASEDHGNQPELMSLAKARKDPPRAVISICAQCHVRNGESRSTGRPYPTNFVAGDNLFKDFAVDWSAADDLALNTIDRHVLQNVRDVAFFGQEQLTCLSCHTVHKSDDSVHRALPRTTYCNTCHAPDKPLTEFIKSTVHSPLCEY